MKMTEIQIVIGALGTILKGFKRGLEKLKFRERIKTTQTTEFLRFARILRRVLETFCLSDSSELPPDTGGKNMQEIIIIIMLRHQQGSP